ncbi:MAG TPA: cytochrome c3 family protein [Novosphingobium sp.]|nr:cytochrome c3 family protein [Novosphingobium sp.]
MTFRLRTIDQTADGREIVREKDLGQPALTVGRAAENDVHLPDLAVEAQHARIADSGDGRVRVEAVGTLGFTLDGRATTSALIDSRSGAELRFGSYRISVARAEDGAVLLTIQPAGAAAEPLDEKRAFSLARSLPGKRAMAWLLGLAILGLFLAWPIASNLTRAPKQSVRGDASWNPGPLSLAHHALTDNCESCHVRAFEAVRSETCQTCHKDVHDHAQPSRMAGAREVPGLGGRFLESVAHSFGKPGPGACVDCHTEHEGAGPMQPTREKFCADCHGTLDQRLRDTRLGNAADFGKVHPQFRPLVATIPGAKPDARVSLGGDAREASGLTFPHRKHLDALGGATRMAMSLGRYGKALGCSDCHHPTEDGVRFKPVEMIRDCESCHSLDYDMVGPTSRTLRHGDIAQMTADLSAADRHVEPIVIGRRRPGEFAAGGRYFSRFSPPVSGAARIGQALSRDGVCGECHTPVFRGGQWTVVPVGQPARYMQHGWFSHRPLRHREGRGPLGRDCAGCHAATTSTTSADLLLPDLKQCRTCHLGESTTLANKTPSGCAMCHGYHPTVAAPRSPWPNAKRAATLRQGGT